MRFQFIKLLFLRDRNVNLVLWKAVDAGCNLSWWNRRVMTEDYRVWKEQHETHSEELPLHVRPKSGFTGLREDKWERIERVLFIEQKRALWLPAKSLDRWMFISMLEWQQKWSHGSLIHLAKWTRSRVLNFIKTTKWPLAILSNHSDEKCFIHAVKGIWFI